MLAVAFAVGFSGLVAMLMRRCFPGWASDSALGRGAGLSLLSIGLALVISGMAMAACTAALGPGRHVIADAYVVAAFGEETARYIALLLLLRGMISDDAREFVVGAAAVGLGFGVMENLLYLSGNNRATMGHLELGVVRGIVSAPTHLACALLSAYGIWAVASRRQSLGLAVLTYLLAILLHGSFDAGVMAWPSPLKPDFEGQGVLALVGLGALIMASIVASAVVSLYVIGEFLGWAQADATHDPASAAPLESHWQVAGRALAAAAIALLVAPLAIAGLGTVQMGVFYAPVLAGAAGSMALWSLAISQLAQ
jgi:hypothetical protein